MKMNWPKIGAIVMNRIDPNDLSEALDIEGIILDDVQFDALEAEIERRITAAFAEPDKEEYTDEPDPERFGTTLG